MKPCALLHQTSSFSNGIFRIRGRTWLAIGAALLAVLLVMGWIAFSLFGWLWGQTRSLADAAPEALRGTAQAVIERAHNAAPGVRDTLEQARDAVPGARQVLDSLAAAPKTEMPQRDVSGGDLGPASRYPGLFRVQWQRTETQSSVEYAGRADFVQVLDHYVRAFAAQGFSQSVQSATPRAETHEYSREGERFIVRIEQRSAHEVSVRVETRHA